MAPPLMEFDVVAAALLAAVAVDALLVTEEPCVATSKVESVDVL
jgi:hypothetical protein